MHLKRINKQQISGYPIPTTNHHPIIPWHDNSSNLNFISSSSRLQRNICSPVVPKGTTCKYLRLSTLPSFSSSSTKCMFIAETQPRQAKEQQLLHLCKPLNPPLQFPLSRCQSSTASTHSLCSACNFA